MKKRNLLVITLLVVVMSLAITVPAGACTQGCTPGYWKRPEHFDSWVGYDPNETFVSVFPVAGFPDPDMTLLEALSAKREDFRSGEEAALVRHAVAALLNATALDDFWQPERVIRKFRDAWKDPELTKTWHEEFKTVNELGCPLD